ncbi:Peptidase S24-like [Chelatococcus sambhunathii]|uniref:Peptidase S24-like n=1 Tax=Chelatococcus sambhunathii TaxID=363953 RepID=A0ABM9U9E4_9HYPH|nr:S24 family peptidase [Chelatococcus sambhunathii]CUA90662.1 Peptidase S24-like [Chelatococcus sambhunathii]
MNLDPVRTRVLKLIEDRDTDLKNASLKIGKNAAYLHQFIFRGTPKVLPEDVRQPLAEFLGVDEDSLRHRRVPPRKPRSKVPAYGDDVGVAPVPASRVPDAFIGIPEIDVRASAGPGAFHEGLEETKVTWLFPEAIVRHEFRAPPNELRMITVDGDSMEPLLSSGDRILIDTSQRVPVPPGIFVIWDGMGLVAKRVEHIPNSDPPKVLIKSINPEYQAYERIAEEVNVVGRVVWLARRV